MAYLYVESIYTISHESKDLLLTFRGLSEFIYELNVALAQGCRSADMVRPQCAVFFMKSVGYLWCGDSAESTVHMSSPFQVMDRSVVRSAHPQQYYHPFTPALYIYFLIPRVFRHHVISLDFFCFFVFLILVTRTSRIFFRILG